MKEQLSLILSIAIFCLLPLQAMAAADAYTTDKMNLRAGPGSDYPIVDILSFNERIELLGCLRGLDWCEIETRYGERGWVSSRYVRIVEYDRPYTVYESRDNGNVHITIFKPHHYWDRYYKKKDFYKDRDQWIGRDDDKPKYSHGKPSDRPSRPVKEVEAAKPRYEKQPTGGRKAYNPNCRMGVNDC